MEDLPDLPYRKAELPLNTPEFTLPSDPHSISTLFQNEIVRNKDSINPYIIIKYCPSYFTEAISRDLIACNIPRVQMFYNEQTREMIAKKLPDIKETGLKSYFSVLFASKANRVVISRQGMYTGRRMWDFFCVNRERAFRKQADNSFIPRLEMNMSTVVFKRGYMDIIDRCRVEAKWWLTASRGSTKAAFVICTNRERPEIIFEEWRMVDDLYLERPTAARTQMVIMTLEDGKIKVTGAPFTLGVDDLVLHEPNCACLKKDDIVVTKEELEVVARV